MEEVDDFLDRAEFTLNGEPDPAGRPPLTARDVEQVRFTSRRFGAGYAEADVDTYLHEHLIPLLTGR
jgi:DivIVA domain-containing protein